MFIFVVHATLNCMIHGQHYCPSVKSNSKGWTCNLSIMLMNNFVRELDAFCVNLALLFNKENSRLTACVNYLNYIIPAVVGYVYYYKYTQKNSTTILNDSQICIAAYTTLIYRSLLANR